MNKNNLKEADEAVSPVIGVILMVAITVVLAAVVFVLVSNLGGGTDAAENAGVNVQSPSGGIIQISLVSVGDNAPYNVSVASTASNYASISINGARCSATQDGTGTANGDLEGSGASHTWDIGEVIRLDNSTVTTSATPASCPFSPGTTVTVTVSLAGTVVFDDTVNVKAV